MKIHAFSIALVTASSLFPHPAFTQDHSAHRAGMDTASRHHDRTLDNTGAEGALDEGGQSAFAAIQEIVALLVSDPETDWSRVDIEALRQHLIDMDNVTLRAHVNTLTLDDAVSFLVTSTDPAVVSSIQAMVPSHAATMTGVNGWTMLADTLDNGARLTLKGTDLKRIRALGFIGVMSVGMHHQAHHLALASGSNPHRH